MKHPQCFFVWTVRLERGLFSCHHHHQHAGFHTSPTRFCVQQRAGNEKQLSRGILTRDNLDQVRENVVKKVYHYMAIYEEFIGIKQVREAHARVLLAEEKFVKSQENRRKAQEELMVMQGKLKVIREELERTPRGNEKYIQLVTHEWNLNREEESFRKQFEQFEDRERETFNELSSALRFSHEKERAQNEKTKYWSVFGSVIGACLGIIGTSINSSLKIRQMKSVMMETSAETMAQVEGRLASLFSQLEGASKTGAPVLLSSTPNNDLENKLLASVDLLSEKMSQLETKLLNETSPPSSEPTEPNLSSSLDVSQVEILMKEQERKLIKVIAVGSVTILVLVPLISKFLFNF